MRFRSLQALRAIAALLVVYFHAVLQFADAKLPLLGSSGVDIFFVLSGFVMWAAHPRARAGGRLAYYRKRIVRVVPLYWIVTGVALAVALAAPALTRSVHADLAHAIASFAFIPYPNPAFPPGSPDALTPVLVPGWTLNYEMFFYLLFGLVLPFRAATRIVVMVGAMAALFAARALLPDPMTAVSFYASTYLLEFLYGVLIARYLDRIALRSTGGAAFLAVAAFAALVAVDVSNVALPPGLVRGVPAAALVLAALSLERCGRWPTAATLHRLGDASYSIYLTHGFAIAALRFAWPVFGLGTGAIAQSVFVVAALVAEAALGAATYQAVERPLLRRASTRREPRPPELSPKPAIAPGE